MKIRTITFFFLLAIMGTFYSCSEGSKADNAADEIARETENALANVGAEIRDESDTFSEKFKKARMNVDQRMEAIKADMGNASEEAKAEMQKELNELETYGNEIDARLARVGDNMSSGWKDFKGELKEGWKNFTSESEQLLNNIERDLDPQQDLD